MIETLSTKENRVAWSCPSNIAIVKYWGKKKMQLPQNPSLSMGLQEAKTNTSLQYQFDRQRKEPGLNFLFEGEAKPDFEKKIRQFLHSILHQLPLLQHCHLEIESENTFPHSSGIASSASAMGALALCVLQVQNQLDPDREFSMAKASSLARMGSGSASRSLYPGFALWGEHESWPGSSDEYAIPVKEHHPRFRDIKDAILIIDSGGKAVSSTAGHAMMDQHPLAESRFRQARQNTARLKSILEKGDWPGFIELMEEEALSLHAMMISSQPSYMLIKGETLKALGLIREFRKDSGLHLGFTLDAGANVHVLYDHEHKESVEAFIQNELRGLCEMNQVIFDQMGDGPHAIL